MEKLFKIIVITSYIAFLIYFFNPYLTMSLYSEFTLEALSWEGYGALVYMDSLVGYLLLAAYTIVLIGLLRFMAWARAFFISLTLISIVFTGVQGLVVLMPFDSVLVYIMNLLDGAAIIMMFTNPISNLFNKETQ